jgi:hypothetical protein
MDACLVIAKEKRNTWSNQAKAMKEINNGRKSVQEA